MSSRHADRALTEHVSTLLSGRGAHLPFDEVVKALPVEVRGKAPRGLPVTPWRLLEHIRIAQWDILEFSLDTSHDSPPWPEGYWPESDGPPDAGAWSASVKAYRSDLAAMQKLVSSSDADLLAPLPGGDGATLLREALLLADHTSYHLGQLVTVRRLLGVWPPSV